MIERGEQAGSVRCITTRIRGSGPREGRLDAVAVEEPLEIRVDGETVAVTMRTPGRDGDLALGFLFAEGIISGPADVGGVSHCGRPGDESYGNVLDVHSAGGHRIDVDRVLEGRRWTTTTSACGVCGRRTIDDLLARIRRLPPGVVVSPHQVVEAMEQLAASQPIFARTGGLHAAAVLDGGALVECAEDVGRHNAVDKVVGALLRHGRVGHGATEPAPTLLAVSGRTSFEIVQKATAAGIACVAGVSAPSSLAIDLARSAGVLLVGFVRGEGFNAYSGEYRLLDASPPAAARAHREVPHIRDAAPDLRGR
jgi:FdhD protein